MVPKAAQPPRPAAGGWSQRGRGT